MSALLAAPIGALIIFGLRIVDVSMGTLRLILGVRGYRVQAASLGFFEVLIWLFAVGAALQHLTSVFHVVGYAGGFAAGNFVGIWLEERFALGTNVVRATYRQAAPTETASAAQQVADTLRGRGFAVTELDGRGRTHPVHILNVVVERKDVGRVMEIMHTDDTDPFITVEEVRATRGGYFRPVARRFSLRSFRR
jgi:uncharacterized protein YebE (UPF0316 family)